MTRLPDPYATRALGAGVSAELAGSRRRGEDAARWKRGAAGEQRTAAILEPLRLAGWIVLHDRSVAGATANIDHLVCDGETLWVLDSKVWRGKVTRLADGQLWYADSPVGARLQALGHLGTRVEQVCSRRPLLADLVVRVTAVIDGACTPPTPQAELIPQTRLIDMIGGTGAAHRSLGELERALRRSFPER